MQQEPRTYKSSYDRYRKKSLDLYRADAAEVPYEEISDLKGNKKAVDGFQTRYDEPCRRHG